VMRTSWLVMVMLLGLDGLRVADQALQASYHDTVSLARATPLCRVRAV
jgi:hypothetical protein